MKTRKLDIEYSRGHTTNETWTKFDGYCPGCSEATVWCSEGQEDYYVGESYICTSCDSSFTLPTFEDIDDNEDKQRLEKLKEPE